MKTALFLALILGAHALAATLDRHDAELAAAEAYYPIQEARK